MTPKDVKAKLMNGDTDFLLVDIRDPEEYRDWNIKGSINLPVNSLVSSGQINEIIGELTKLPRDKKIVTICARGINSQVIAGMLQDLNYDAVHMERGMKGWNENFDVYEIELSSPDARLKQFVRIGKGCLSYIAWSESSKEAAVFDPSIFTDQYTRFISAAQLKPRYVIDTHSHADHFSGGMALAKALGIPYYVSKVDTDDGFDHNSFEGISELSLGDFIVRVLPTPGHTDGSLSFLVDEKALVCGDLLLIESVGRPDLARTQEETERAAQVLFDTLNGVVLKLDDSVLILPAHFVSTSLRPVTTTLGEMKRQNSALSILEKEKFVQYITESIPLTPPNYESIKKYNKKGIIMPLDYAEDVEIGPNRCAARN